MTTPSPAERSRLDHCLAATEKFQERENTSSHPIIPLLLFAIILLLECLTLPVDMPINVAVMKG
jgi:hypothetical protein